MRPVLAEMYELWNRKDSATTAAFSKTELRDFVRWLPLRLFKILVDDRMTNETFDKWKRECGEYAKNVSRLAFTDDDARATCAEPLIEVERQQRQRRFADGPSTSKQENTEKNEENDDKNDEHNGDEYGD